MKLYEIVDEIRVQLDAIANEDLTPQDAAERLRALTAPFQDKLRAVVAYALELSELSKARAAAAKRMAEGAKSMQAKADSLMDYAQISIENTDFPMPLRLTEFTLNLAKMPPKSDVFNDGLVPTEYRTRTATFTIKAGVTVEAVNTAAQALADLSSDVGYDDTVRKIDILADLKAGVLIPGAKLEPTAYRLTAK